MTDRFAALAEEESLPPGPGRTRTRSRVLVALALSAALISGSASAQESPAPAPESPAAPVPDPAEKSGQTSGIEEIVVRGTASDASRDFAAGDSVTGFGAEDLQALGASDISDLAAFTPNLEIVTYGATTPTFFIRGVGLNDFNSNSTGSVAVYQDDVAINAPALQLATLYDMETVNVLRGPQGTGLARNASAGAIKLYSRKPSGEFGGYMRTDFGNFDLQLYEGAVEAPVYEDILAARFAFRYTDRDGTMRNRCGDALPFAARVPVPLASAPPSSPNFPGLRQLGKSPTDGPWSICGEPVTGTAPAFSDIPEGLEKYVNDTHNWAARGTLLFQPTLDMTWLINGHGSRRDELTQLGQSYGVSGGQFFTCFNDDIDNCGYPGQGSSASRIVGRLGGSQGTGVGYTAPEVKKRLIELAPCFAGVPDVPQPCNLMPNRLSANQAKIKVAHELANKLDEKPWAGDFNRTGPTKNDTYGSYVKGDIVLPYGMQLTTTTGYDVYDRKIDIDLDFSPQTLFHILTKDHGWQVVSDLKLQGQFDDEGAYRWEVGGWFLREQLNVDVQNDLGENSAFGAGRREYQQDLYSTAGYANLSFDFWEDFTLDGGVRFNWEEKQLDYRLFQGVNPTPFPIELDDTWQAPTGTIRLTYRVREDTHLFWKYTRGWKPGTYNATSALRKDFAGNDVAPDISVAKPEQIDAFETGLRGSWLDGRLGLEAQFFYYAYRDYQIFTAQQFSGGQPEFVILNAEDAEVYGAEVDATARPWSGLFLNVRFGWIESQFLDFVQLQQEIVNPPGRFQVTVNRELQNTGNHLLNSPQFKVSIIAEQTIPMGRWGSIAPRYDGVWTDTTFYDATEGRGIPNQAGVNFLPPRTIAQGPFWLHNLRLSWRPPIGQMELAAWVRNLTNEPYKTFAFDGSTFNNTTIYFVGDQRTYGGSFIINF
jgi:outer membrane receptor protein involved in Fe transport